MHFYLTRRKYDPASDTFTKEIAPKTSYVVLPKDNVNAGFRTDQADWLSKIAGGGGPKDVVIFVHGFNTSQDKMLTRLRKLKTGLRKNNFGVAVVGFSWPNRERARGYWKDRDDVPKFAKSLLHDGIQPIRAMASKPRVHVLCHSMGAYVFLHALSAEGIAQRIDQLAFVASDLDESWMRPGEPAEKVVHNHTKRLTNYYSPTDRVLDLSATWIHGEPRVGGVGLSRHAKPSQQDVACSNRYQARPVPPKKDRTNSHVWYFDDEKWLRDLAQVLARSNAGQIDTRLPSTTPPDQVLAP
ncbi:MAG: alpha/beta fold hydrolase [Pseudomonadota bacterium]